MDADFRQLETSEMEQLKKFLDHEFLGRDELRLQLASLTANRIDENGSLVLKSGVNNRADVLCSCPTGGICLDADGGEICVMLHVKNGVMHLLDIFKEDGSELQRPPNAEALFAY